jgi:hypothetical protein
MKREYKTLPYTNYRKRGIANYLGMVCEEKRELLHLLLKSNNRLDVALKFARSARWSPEYMRFSDLEDGR